MENAAAAPGVLVLLCALVWTLPVAAEEAAPVPGPLPSELHLEFARQPAALAPMGVPDGQTLAAFQWAFSYRYELLHLDDMRNNTHRVSTTDLLNRFQATPRQRDREMHRLELSFAPHDRVTLAVALPIYRIKTNMINQGLENYTTRTKGVGDLEMRVLVPFMRNGGQSLQVEAGLTAPTGSTGEDGRNFAGTSQRLSFQQQHGSGTVDFLPGAVYRGFYRQTSWGMLGRGVVRLYQNSKGYRRGDEYELSSWVAQSWTDWMSTSVRVSYQRWEKIGRQDDFTLQNPELNPKKFGGRVIELGPGVNFKLPFEHAPRLGVEVALPVFQDLQGPQIERDFRLTAGWRWEL